MSNEKLHCWLKETHTTTPRRTHQFTMRRVRVINVLLICLLILKKNGRRERYKGITHYIHYRNTTSNDFQSKDWNYLLNATTRVHVLSCRSFADITSLQIINLKNSYILNLCNFGCIPFVLFAGITEWMRQDYFFLLTSLSAALPIAIYIQQPRKNATHLSLCPEA